MRLPLPRLIRTLLALALFAGTSRAQVRQPPGHQPELACSLVQSELHGVLVLRARSRLIGGPLCDVLVQYGDWLKQSDALRAARRGAGARLTGREWDFASAAMRLGAMQLAAPGFFLVVRGDSLTPGAAGVPRRLHLTAFAGGEPEPLPTLGSWFVLVDEDSTSGLVFRSAVAGRRLQPVLEVRGSLVYSIGSAPLDGARVREQLVLAGALRNALGFTTPLPTARYVLGNTRDSTLAMLGVTRMERPFFAMMVFPPLTVFSPRSASGGLDDHEIVHVATFGRRDVIPGSVGEAFAMHHGGAQGRPFGEAFCASVVVRGLPPLTVPQLDSALGGRWWNDARADVAGFALGHTIGWFIEQHGDSAWIFAEGESATDNDAVGFLARRSAIPRDSAMRAVASTLAERRAECPSTSPGGAAVVPSLRSRRGDR